MRLLVSSLLGLALLAPSAAMADDDWLEDEDLFGEDDAPSEDRPSDEAERTFAPDDDLDWLDEEEEEEEVEGQDSASIYREQRARVEDLDPDDELLAWEAYLRQYPNSNYRTRIERRMAELEESMYDMRIDRTVGVDPATLELPFSQGMHLDSINPRSRLQAGFEWGTGNYMNLVAGYEHALQRELSLQVGVRRRHTGVRGELGGRWAFVKSNETQTLGVAMLDIQQNFNPAYTVVRPGAGFGQKLGPVDLQAQLGVELLLTRHAGVRYFGGANATWQASEQVGIFVETNSYLQWLRDSRDQPLDYRHNSFNFGLKLYPGFEGIDAQQLEVNLGANVPYAWNYWMPHYGSIMALANFYL